MNKIFNISLHRNATQSINDFFKRLGYKSQHWPGKKFDTATAPAVESFDYDFVYKLYAYWLNNFDVFSDLPMPFIYPKLVEHFPEARFLLVKRNSLDWVTSIRNHLSKRAMDPMESLQYSFIMGELVTSLAGYSDASLESAYEKFYVEATNTLEKNGINFLLINLADEYKTQKLAQFIGLKDAPELGFVDVTK